MRAMLTLQRNYRLFFRDEGHVLPLLLYTCVNQLHPFLLFVMSTRHNIRFISFIYFFYLFFPQQCHFFLNLLTILVTTTYNICNYTYVLFLWWKPSTILYIEVSPIGGNILVFFRSFFVRSFVCCVLCVCFLLSFVFFFNL